VFEAVGWAPPNGYSIPAQAGIQTKGKSLCISLLRKGGDYRRMVSRGGFRTLSINEILSTSVEMYARLDNRVMSAAI
jgi:hypothetical protein